jgi:hypothetical protein
MLLAIGRDGVILFWPVKKLSHVRLFMLLLLLYSAAYAADKF